MKQPKEIFCGKLAHKQMNWYPYQKLWYGRCYVKSPIYNFDVVLSENEEGFSLPKIKDDQRFMEGIDCAHLR